MNPWEENWAPETKTPTGANPWDEDWGGSDAPASVGNSDTWTAGLQGLEEVPGAITGLADIPAGLVGLNRPFSRAAEAAGEVTGFEPGKWAKADDAKYSDKYKAQKAEIDAIENDPNLSTKDTAIAMAKFYASNPSYTGLNIVRSAPSMVLGGGYARLLKGTGAGAVKRGAAGEGAVMAGQQMETIDPNVDPARAALASLSTGVIGAGIGAAGGKLANKMGIGDIDTMLAGGGVRGTGPVDLVKRGVAKRAGIGLAQEGTEELGQSLTEQGAKNLAEDKPFSQGMMRAGMEGTLAGGTLGGAMGAISRGEARPVVDETAQSDEAATVAQEATPTAQAQDQPSPMAGNPLIEQEQAAQEQEARAQKSKENRDALIAKVGGITPLEGGTTSKFNGEVFHHEEGKLDKKISKFVEEDQSKPQIRRDLEEAYVAAYNDYHKEPLAAGEKQPLKYNDLTGKASRLVAGATDMQDAATRISNIINSKIKPNGTASPETELLQDVYQRFTGQEHPSVKRSEELQHKVAKEKEVAKPAAAVGVPTPAPESAPKPVAPVVVAPEPAATPEVVETPTPVVAAVKIPVQTKAVIKKVAVAAAATPNIPAQKGLHLVTVSRQGKEVKLPKETLTKDLKTAMADPKKSQVIADVTGTGAGEGTTMSFREAAVASLARKKVEPTEVAVNNERKRIHKMLAGLGITESVVDKVSAMDQGAAQLEDVSESEESGVRVVNSPNASDTIEPLTAGQKRLQKEADDLMAAKKDVKSPEVITAKEQAVEDAIDKKRRDEAAANLQAALAKAAQSPYASEVREDWNDMADVLDGVTPEFDQLSMNDRAALVTTYGMWKNDEISYAQFEAEQRDISRDQETVNVERNQGISNTTGKLRNDDSRTKGGSEAVHPGVSQDSNAVGSPNEAGTGTQGKAPKVAVKKKRLAVVPVTNTAEEFNEALADLADIVGQVAKSNVVPQENQKLVDVLARLMGAAVRMGYTKVEDAVKFVMDAVKKRFGKRADALVSENTLTEAHTGKGPGLIERNVSKLPKGIQGSAFIAATNIKDLIQRGVMGLSFGHDLADMASKTLPSAKQFFDMHDLKEAVKNKMEIAIDAIAREGYAVKDKKSLNRFLKNSTRSQKWGYQPEWLTNTVYDAAAQAEYDKLPKKDRTPEALKKLTDTAKEVQNKVTIDAKAQAEYKALSNDSRVVADKMFHQGWKSSNELVDTVRSAINSGFDGELKLASKAEKADIAKRRMREMRLFDTQFQRYKGPYAPLSRVGDYVMVAKSQARIDAELAGDNSWLEKEGVLPEHYVVEFHDSEGEAKWSAKQHEDTYANAVGSTKQAYAQGISEAPWSALGRLKTLVDEHFKDSPKENKAALTQINQLLKDLYLSTLAETAARKHDLKRQNIEGASDDMLKAFVSKGKADAHFIAALTHTGQVQDSIVAMRAQAHGTTEDSAGRSDRTKVFNEILRRHAGSMDYRPTPIQDKILMLNTVMMLITKPFYFLQNLTQTPMMTLPVLAGLHGYFRSVGALVDAYSDMVHGFGKDSAVKGFLAGKFDIDAMPIAKAEKAALHKLMELGILDIGINLDMGYWESRGGVGQVGVDVIHKLTTLVKQVEVINRVSSALASYRLAGGGQKGIDEATHIVRVTHGNYSNFNEPSFFKKVGNVSKLILQFRKFQLIQLSLMARLTHQAFKGDTKEAKAAAKASLAFTLGHYGVMAGVLGMPAMSTVGMVIAAAFGDDEDEEPKDFEMLVRRAIDNEDIADLLLKGAPTMAGMDLSGSLGAGNMTSILPFGDWKLDSKKGYQETAVGLLGPAIGGTAPRIAEGIGMMGKGDIYKGFEKMLPNGVGNAMKAYREATEGMTNKNNDMTLSPDEISYWDTLLTALSIRTQTSAKTQFVQGQKIAYENFYKERTGEIKHRYISAWKEGDGDTMEDMRTQWQDVQASKTKNGFARQPMRDLMRAPLEQMKKERNTSDGVQFQKGSRRFVQQMGEL